MKIELFNLSYFIAFALLTIGLRIHERKAYRALRALLDQSPQGGDPSARVIELDNAHSDWMRRMGRLEVVGGLLASEAVGLLIWCAWTTVKPLWGAT